MGKWLGLFGCYMPLIDYCIVIGGLVNDALLGLMASLVLSLVDC